MSDMDTLKQEGEKIAKQLGLKKAKGYTEPNLRWEFLELKLALESMR